MTIVEIIARENNSHRNQCGNCKIIPEGWAVVPDDLETPNFPFGNIVVEEIDGVMTVTKWTACPCPEPENTLKLESSIDLSSYFAFCAMTDEDTAPNHASYECAFGKNNEDRILNLGLQLAMYSWFCGDSKTDYPFTELCKCSKLTDIEHNVAAFTELWENKTLRDLYTYKAPYPYGDAFPSNRILSCKKLDYDWEDGREFAPITITDEDIAAGYVAWELHSNNNSGVREILFNGVLVTSYDRNFEFAKVFKLSDFGINSPGTYELETKGSLNQYESRLLFIANIG